VEKSKKKSGLLLMGTEAGKQPPAGRNTMRKRLVRNGGVVAALLMIVLVVSGCPLLTNPMDEVLDEEARTESAEDQESSQESNAAGSGNVSVVLVVPVFDRPADGGTLSAQSGSLSAQVIAPSTSSVRLLLDGSEVGTIAVSTTGGDADGTNTSWNDYFYTQWTGDFVVPARTYTSLRVELLDASGTVLTAGEISDDVTVPEGVVTTINVSAFPVSGQHTPLTVGGGSASGSVAQGRMQYFSFNATAGDILNITVSPSTGEPDVYLFGPTGAPTGSVEGADYAYTGGADKTLTKNIQHNGTHWIGVYGWGAASEFTVEVRNGSTAPTGLSASNGSSESQIYLSWSAVTGASSYRILRSTSQTGTFATLASTASTSYTDGGHGASSEYWYKVQAYIAGTYGPETSAVRGYTRTATPTLVSVSLGSAAVGSVTLSWNAVPKSVGFTTYYVYRRESPTDTSSAYVGTTGSTSETFSVPEGTIYYFSVWAKNSVTGWSAESNRKPGYTSNIAVVYNDADTTDSNLATEIKDVLTSDLPNTSPYSSYVSGTMPSWSVTLIPQSMIPYSYSPSSIFYGDPVIVTPGTTIYGSNVQTRHVVGHDLGVVAMGHGGARLLDTCEVYWSSWGFSGVAPTDIGWGESMIITKESSFMYTWTSGNSVWKSPLSSTLIPGGLLPVHDSRVQISYRNHERIAVYRANDDNPPYGWIYGRDDWDGSTHHYPVVRQDRFLQFGFDSLTNRPYTGHVYFINLVARMAKF
jgi:hypothetical protein